MAVLAVLLVGAPGVVATRAAPSPAAAPELGLVAGRSATGFAEARAAGLRAVSLLADWSLIEARRGQPVWDELDRAVAAAAQEGLAPVVVLAHTPRWASLATGVDLTRPEVFARQPPRDVRDWDRFVGWAVARYRGRVRDWQIWTHLGLPAFRGTGSEYLALLQTASARIRALDPQARVIATSPAGVDLGFAVRLAETAPAAFDAIVVPATGMSPEALLRPLGVLGARLRERGRHLWLQWAPDATADAPRAAGEWLKMLLVADATGVQRLVAAEPERSIGAVRQAVTRLGARRVTGYLLRDPEVFVAAAESPEDGILAAWARGERTLELPAAPGIQGVPLDGRAGALEVRDGRVLAHLREIPLVLTGVPAGLLEEARATAARRPWLPLPARDYSGSREVQARLGNPGEEHGLYNAAYRHRPNGAVEVIDLDGTTAVRTAVGRGVVYVYFDVDDTFLYFAEGRVPLEVHVEVWGARASQQLGFNLLYDAAGGYRFTPWVWVEPGEGWRTYTIRLPDASFANTWGYDFAINAAGNRVEDLTVRTVRVRKVAP
ncbi:MAG: hypothetical protein QN157_11645 [Armatimonadota bacterium]|nr:hypothetical protein [Armatimonadota bacterium]